VAEPTPTGPKLAQRRTGDLAQQRARSASGAPRPWPTPNLICGSLRDKVRLDVAPPGWRTFQKAEDLHGQARSIPALHGSQTAVPTSTMTWNVFHEVDLEHAVELLTALAPEQGGHLWQRVDHGDWLFRGQRDADWHLVPSAHRDDILPRFFSAKRKQEGLTLEESVDLELEAVAEFADLVDANGFELPGDTPQLRAQRLRVHYDGTAFPPDHLHGVFALAQHHRVPTRLLDWTLDPMMAAYFASVDAAFRSAGLSNEIPPRKIAPERSGRLAIWALSKRYLQGVVRGCEPGADLVTAATKSNPTLRAQKGVFTLVRFAVKTPPWPVPPLDVLIRETQRAKHPASLPEAPMLFKFTLPCRQAPELLYLLRLRGVSAATVFPGLDSLARTICEKQCARTQMIPAGNGQR
jgi:hypothetical protein